MGEKIGQAHTQYCDLMGTCAADWEGNGFADLCRLKGIDTERFRVVSMSLWGFPVSQCSIIVVDMNVVGRSFDDVGAYSRSHNGCVPVHDFHFFTTPEEIGPYIKEFSAELVHRDIGIDSIDVIERVDLE